MELVRDLKDRGLIQESSADPERIFDKKRTVYIGTDPTADSLHVGHLAWIFLMKRLADSGNKIILLTGGGTGMIGDPKEKGERPLLALEEIEKNAEALSLQLSGLLGGQADFEMVNNADWLREVRLLEFLRDVGKHFTVNDLIKREIIKRRLDSSDDSISYTEFTYSLLQAYDYWELNKRFGCDLQVGASDQWTNILSGVDLIRKKEGSEVFALAIPLVTDASGRKFGKSEGNAVWLDAKKTSSYQFYQFWMGVEDSKVEDYLKVYTFLALSEIDELIKEHLATPGGYLAQKKLAMEVTTFVHGKELAKAACSVSGILFGDKKVSELSEVETKALLENAPVFNGAKGRLFVEVLVESGLATSKREAREFVTSGAVSLDGEKVTDLDGVVDFSNLAVLKRGKKNLVVLN